MVIAMDEEDEDAVDGVDIARTSEMRDSSLSINSLCWVCARWTALICAERVSSPVVASPFAERSNMLSMQLGCSRFPENRLSAQPMVEKHRCATRLLHSLACLHSFIAVMITYYPGTLGISHGTTHYLLVCGLRLLICVDDRAWPLRIH